MVRCQIPNSTIHIVMVHGMTDHLPGYGETFANNIATRLNLKRDSETETNYLPLPVAIAKATNVLRHFSYSLGTNTRVFVHELTWTPTTYGFKTDAFAEDRRLDARRVLVNRTLKSRVIDEGFGDAVLYLNPKFQNVM